MSRGQPIDLDLENFYQQIPRELAQARTLDAAVNQSLVILDSALQPIVVQVVWSAQRPRVLGALGDAELCYVDTETRMWLERGELAISGDDGDITVCFAPLLARGELLGWLYIETHHWSPESTALVSALSIQLGPVLAFLDASIKHEERVAQLQTLSDVGRLISGVLDFDTLLDAIYAAVKRVVDVSNFYIAMYDAPTDTLHMSYFVRNGVRRVAQFSWPASEGLGGLLIRQRRPLRTDDYVSECVRQGVKPRPLGDLPVGKAWIGVPLFASDEPIGIMNISSMRPDYTYTDEHVELITAIGAQAAIALENARLYQQSELQGRQLATLNRIGRNLTSSLDPERVPQLIMEQVCSLLEVEEGSLLLVDETDGDLVFAYTNGPVGHQLLGQRLPRGAGLAGYVATKGESIVVNNVQGDNRFYAETDQTTGFITQTLLAVPLRAVSGVQGVIEVMNKRNGSPFTDDDRRMLESVADQAVIALENARKFAQVDLALARRAQELASTNAMLQHNLQSLTALNALGMAINTTLRNPIDIFGMTARGVVEMTGAQGAVVLLPREGSFGAVVQIGSYPAVELLQPVVQRVMRVGRPELVTYNEALGHALLAVPLRAPQRSIGVLCVFYGDTLPAAPDQETVVLFATQAAAAVESLELFTAVRGARDQMASILASTREGIMLVDADQHIVLANPALYSLTELQAGSTQGACISDFLASWEQNVSYASEEWVALHDALEAVTSGRQLFASGYLNAPKVSARSFEWAALTVRGSGTKGEGALMVLRDITASREAERLRQDLTNMIVHDLRSPLASVMAAIDLLTKGVSGELNSNQRGVLGIAYASAVQMLEMISTLLDISRLEDGRMPLTLGSFHITSVVERAISGLSTWAQDRQIVIQTALSQDLPLVYVDQELVVRVVQNLLGNAIKFSHRGSTVLVRAELANTDSSSLCISVSDRGIGIAPKDQEKIFAKFGQAGDHHTGTGLGLTFCKLVVEAHKGQIWVESQLGHGSTFYFTIPLA